jgi:hypothetical protein
MKTQHEKIRKYLDDFGSITPMQAFADLGITKLSTRVNEMIRNGEQINKRMINRKNRNGEPVRFMMYEKAV